MAVGEDPILILSGPPGVGKTTVAGILSARGGRAVHLQADTFFGFIRSGYVEPWRPESHRQNQIVMGVLAAAAAGYAAAGYLTLIDGIIIPGWFLEPLREQLAEAGQRVAYAVLRAPLELCLERVRSRGGYPSLQGAAIEQLWQSFAELGEYEQNVLAVEGLDPEQVCAELTRRLETGRLAL